MSSENQARPSVCICTLGCKVNQYESEALAERFIERGFLVLSANEPCDVFVINTCTVTAESDRKARQLIRRAVLSNPDACIIVTGCYAQTSPLAIASIDGVDAIVGNRDKYSVVEKAIARLQEKGKKTSIDLSVPSLSEAPFEAMQITHFDRTRAYVKIEDGCESNCTYCIIPKARGPIRSKQPGDVLREVRTLIDHGCPEIVLTGIETASYGKDLGNASLASLLAELDRIPGRFRIRLGSLDPSLIRPAFLEQIAGLKSLAPHFHLSMQSGSSRVLARMKRKYNREQALAAIDCLRQYIPEAELTTDIIVGFPGETEEDFLETVSLVEKVGFLRVHIFPYSKREGTLAAVMPDQILEEEKHRRLTELSKVEQESRRRIHLREINRGNPQEVLFESRSDGYLYGHTPTFLEVRVKEPAGSVSYHGVTAKVLLTGTDGESCEGILLPDSIA